MSSKNNKYTLIEKLVNFLHLKTNKDIDSNISQEHSETAVAFANIAAFKNSLFHDESLDAQAREVILAGHKFHLHKGEHIHSPTFDETGAVLLSVNIGLQYSGGYIVRVIHFKDANNEKQN